MSSKPYRAGQLRSRRNPAAISRGSWRPRLPAPGTATGSTAGTHSRIPPRDSSPRARTGRRRWSIPPRSAGPTATGRASGCDGAGALRAARRHLHAGGDLGRGRRGSSPHWPTLGITVLEVMPVAEFPGRFGWGYDGVDLFAPTRLYGTPDDFRALRRPRPRARARRDPRRGLQPPRPRRQLPHAVLAALLHRPLQERVGRGAQLRRRRLGGRCASSSSPTPATGSTSSTSTACGSTPRRPSSTTRPSTSSPAIAARARGRRPAAGAIFLVAENEPQDARLRPARRAGRLRPRRALERRLPPQRGRGAAPAATRPTTPTTAARRRSSSRRRSRASSIQGQWYSWQKQRRGDAALDLPPAPFVTFIQNHDQVANSARGERLHQLTSPGRCARHDRAAAARPRHADALPGPGVRRRRARSSTSPTTPASWRSRCADGRLEFLAQFPSLAAPEMQARVPDPRSPDTFELLPARLARARDAHAAVATLCTATCCAAPGATRLPAQRPRQSTAPCSAEAFVLRFFGA